MYELLDDVLAPGAERTAPEPARESFHAGEPDPEDLGRVAVEHDDAGVGDDPPDLVLLPRFEVVVAEHRDRRNLHRRGELLDERARFVRETVVRQVAAEDEHVGRFGDLREERLQSSRRGRAAVVQVADRRDADGFLRRHTSPAEQDGCRRIGRVNASGNA